MFVSCFNTPMPGFLVLDVFFSPQPSIFLPFLTSRYQLPLCPWGPPLHCLFPAPSPIPPFLPPSLAAGRFSNIHYFHQGHCNPTGSAKDLAGADKGPPCTRHCNNLTNPSLTQNPLRQRGIPVFSIKPLKSTWCHIGGREGGAIG